MNLTGQITIPRAVIAEDEPLLAQALQAELAHVWPDLSVVALASDGQQALQALVDLRPDVAFLDIRMPVLSGLEVAQAIAEDWPHDTPPPLLVFVTAYDAHAIEAFDLAAADYLLKPVRRDRLALAASRLQHKLTGPEDERDLLRLAAGLAPLLGRLQRPVADTQSGTVEPLRMLAAGVGNRVQMIPVADVAYLQATDKYVNVVGAHGEALLRASLSWLEPRLDERFQRVHRGTIVNLDHVHSAVRDESGKLLLSLRGRSERVLVSRLYAGLFKAM